MLCGQCGTENREESLYCKKCRAPVSPDAEPLRGAADLERASRPALLLTTAWSRKGPILMAVFTVLMMAMVFAPWAFVRLDVFKLTVMSRSYSGWEIYIPRVLFFLSFIPLLISLLMVAGVGTRRRVVETHICVFFAGVMFTVWLIIFALSEVLKSVMRNIQFIQVSPAGAQVLTILFFLGFMLGVIVTSYDRGRLLAAAGEGG